MTPLEVLVWPHKTLETRAEEVTLFDEDLQAFVKNMHLTMDHANGIGLAANQVDDLRRVVVIHIPGPQAGGEDEGETEQSEELKDWHDKRWTFINPRIVKKQGKIKYQEGCLSFPEMYDWVDRAANIEVAYQDETGSEKTVHADGLFSICLQHEIDHLDGIVFFNRMSRLKSQRIKKMMLKREKNFMSSKDLTASRENEKNV